MHKIKVLLPAVMLAAMLSGCAATGYLASLPDDTTLVFVSSSSASKTQAESDKATCLGEAYQKADKARDNRILPQMVSQVASVAGGAALGAAGGGLLGHGRGGYAATGAVIGAATGVAYGAYTGAMGAYLARLDPDQAAFDAAFAKCAEEHGHSVRLPGAGQSGPAPGIRF